MTATEDTNGPAVPPALPPRIYRNVSSDIPRSQPIKPPRKSKTQESTSVSGVIPEAIYEDPDALLNSNPDVSQSEAKPRPIPRPRIKDKPNPQLYDTNNTTKANYVLTNSEHNDNPANTHTDNTTNTSSSPYRTDTTYKASTTYQTGTTTTTNANTVTKSHNIKRPSSTSTNTIDSTYNTNKTNRAHNANTATSSDRTGNTKDDASYQRRKNSNNYRTPRPAHQSPLLPIPPETKSVNSTAGDSPQNYNSVTNSNITVKARDVISRHRASPRPHMHHSSSMLDLSSLESYQSRTNSDIYMTPRPAHQPPLPPIPPETKGLNSTAADSPQNYTTRTNSNTSVKKPPPLPPPRLQRIYPLYCDKANPTSQNRDNTSRRGTPTLPRPHSYYSGSMLDLSSWEVRETTSLFDPEEELYYTSGSSQYTNNLNPRYIDVKRDHDFYWQRASTRRYDDNNQSTYNSIYQLSPDDITELLQWLKRVSRQSDTLSLYGLSMEDEVRSFNQQALHVRKARRLYHLLMMKRKETMQNILKEFKVICDKLEKVQKTNKNMGIAGGTAGAVGGVTAVVGIALAPVTMGASLIATAVGAGIAASAGGFGAHAAKANKKIVNRETVQKLVDDYKSDVADLEHCLNYILCGMKELRRHNIGKVQRAGAHPDALRMADLSQVVLKNNSRPMIPTNPGGLASESLLKHFEAEFDEYFTEKNGQKLKKSNKSKFSGKVCTLVINLQEELTYLIQMWEVLA